MKKTIVFLLLILAVNSVFAQKLTVKNIFGANLDEFGDYDLFSHAAETDIGGNEVLQNIFSIGDRFQTDYNSKLIDARLRLDLLYANADDDTPNLLFAPSGFVKISPFKQLSFIAGTNFYKEFAIHSAYLAAADDTTKYGRLLTDSLGYEAYLYSGNAGMFLNGFCGGISSDWTFGTADDIYLKLAAGATMYAESSSFGYAIDAGINGGIENLFDAGFTAHNINSDERKFAFFAGLNSVPNLILNAGFYYNFTLSDYLPEARVERSNVDEFKKQKTKYALGFTGGYDFVGTGLGLYADIITGLNDEYIGEIKYYTGDVLTSSVVSTIKRGSTIVKYKNGNAKRTDGFTEGAVPFYSQLRLDYDATDYLKLAFNIKLRTMMGDSSQTWLTFYPRTTFDLPSKLGSITAGLRLDMNFTRYEGISGISIPLSYTYKFKKKF